VRQSPTLPGARAWLVGSPAPAPPFALRHAGFALLRV